MQKKIFLFVFSVSAFLFLQAQVTETAVIAVRYTFLYVTDTTQPADITVENMILYLGKNASAYKSYDKMLRDSIMKEQIEKSKVTAASGAPVTITVPPGRAASPTSFYKDLPASKLNRVENFIKNYLIEEEMPSINWIVTQDTKEIRGLSCQKATATFGGRNYTAWFNAQLPYSNGPWKLGGLPGLIIEAEDDQNQVVFRFAGFEDVSSKNISIALPADAIKTTAKEYAQFLEMVKKDPMGFMNSSLAGGGGLGFKPGNISGGNFVPNANFKRKLNNNPMERKGQ